jgi:hypothetical protein
MTDDLTDGPTFSAQVATVQPSAGQSARRLAEPVREVGPPGGHSRARPRCPRRSPPSPRRSPGPSTWQEPIHGRASVIARTCHHWIASSGGGGRATCSLAAGCSPRASRVPVIRGWPVRRAAVAPAPGPCARSIVPSMALTTASPGRSVGTTRRIAVPSLYVAQPARGGPADGASSPISCCTDAGPRSM